MPLDAMTATSPLAEAKVVFVMGDLGIMGGAERQALVLASHLIEEKHARVEFWGLGTEIGEVAHVCDEKGIPWRMHPTPWLTRRATKAKHLATLALALRRARPDVLLPYMIIENVACGLIWRWTGARVCIWNQRCVGVDRLGIGIERSAVRRTPYFVTNSLGGAEFLTATLGAPAQRVRVIHNGVRLPPAESNRAEWRRKLGISDDTFAACMIANLTAYKDHATLLSAWRRVIDGLKSRDREAVLLLAGCTDTSNNTYEASKALGFDLDLGKYVRFLGYVQDIPGLIAASDLGVLSSRSESGPNGVLEPMAGGLAVAGTDNSGIREAVGPDGYQFLAAPGNADALADRILKLATHDDLRARIGAANRLRIQVEFDPRVTCEQMAALIGRGIREGKTSGTTVVARQGAPRINERPNLRSQAKF